MSATDEYLQNNAGYAEGFSGPLPLPPARKSAVVTCMNARLSPYGVLGLTEGDKAMSNGEDMPPELAGIVGCAFMSMGDGSSDSDSGSGSVRPVQPARSCAEARCARSSTARTRSPSRTPTSSRYVRSSIGDLPAVG